jgi:hypothetical protein
MIRKNAITAITSLGILSAIGACFTFAHPSAVQAAPQTPIATTLRPFDGDRDRDDRERHPELRQALMALSRAKQDLQRGAHDYDGHRARALQLTDQAIEAVHDAMQADRH